ncbi:MAG: TRAP transporter small permease subunit [Hylemonella sp.]|nr:TRAP transporter small permease subunit [Hylemonella sp.]
MNVFLTLSRIIDGVSHLIGKLTMWLILATTLISAGNAIVRKLFDTSSNALLEIQWYLFAGVFMLGAGYVLLKNAHVRIDFISARLSPRTRNWIDAVGIVVVLIPFCLLTIHLGWAYFLQAWESGEVSSNAGGLIRWPVYLLIPAGFALLLMQSLSELIKRILFLMGLAPDSLADEEHKTDEQKHLEELEAIAARRLAGEK